MARRPQRTPQRPAPTVGERLAVMETLLQETLNSLPGAIEAAIARGMADVPRLAALESLAARVIVLEQARAYSAGAVKVENRTRSELQEWARTLMPYVFTAAATFLGYRAFG